MIVDISAEAEDYLLYDIRDGIQHANEHSRLFHQQLSELDWRDEDGHPLIDRLVVTRDQQFRFGPHIKDVLIFTLHRDGFHAKQKIINASDVQDRHPTSHEILFRGHRLIEEILLPTARGDWTPIL